MTNQFHNAAWYNPPAECYSAKVITSGIDAGKVATLYNGVIICLSDNAQDAADYAHKYAAMRVSAFNVDTSSLLANVDKGNS